MCFSEAIEVGGQYRNNMTEVLKLPSKGRFWKGLW